MIAATVVTVSGRAILAVMMALAAVCRVRFVPVVVIRDSQARLSFQSLAQLDFQLEVQLKLDFLSTVHFKLDFHFTLKLKLELG